MASVRDVETQIFEREGVRVILRVDSKIELPDYGFERRLPDNSNLSDLRDRISRSLNDTSIEVVIILGDGNSSPHGLTGMEKARNSYK